MIDHCKAFLLLTIAGGHAVSGTNVDRRVGREVGPAHTAEEYVTSQVVTEYRARLPTQLTRHSRGPPHNTPYN
jgi:hypothetical protein